MSYNTNHKASSNIKFYEIAESTVGTAMTEAVAFNRLNVEGVSVPINSLPYSVSAPRSGLFTTSTDQSRHDGLGKTHAIDVTYKATALSMARACYSVLESASATATLSTGYTFPQGTYQHGAGSATTSTICLGDAAPGTTNDTMIYAGCIGTGMTLSADVGSDGGELKCAVNYMTGYAPAVGNYSFGGSLVEETAATYNLRDNVIASTTILGQDLRISAFELAINRPIEKIGGFKNAYALNATAYDPDGYAMTGPWEVTGSVTCMLDTNVETILAKFYDNTSDTIAVGSGTSGGDWLFTLANCKAGEVTVDNGGPALMCTIPFTCNGLTNLTTPTAFVTFDFS